MGDTGRLAAAGANNLDLAGVDRGLCLDDAAGLAHLAGLYVLRDNVGILYDDLALFRGNSHDLALLAAVFTAEDNDGVTGFNMNFTHFRTPPIKELPGRGTESSCIPCRAVRERPARRYVCLWGFYHHG